MSVTLTSLSVSATRWTRNGSTILSDDDLGNQAFDYKKISDKDCIIKKNNMHVSGITPYRQYSSHVTAVKSRASVFQSVFNKGTQHENTSKCSAFMSINTSHAVHLNLEVKQTIFLLKYYKNIISKCFALMSTNTLHAVQFNLEVYQTLFL